MNLLLGLGQKRELTYLVGGLKDRPRPETV